MKLVRWLLWIVLLAAATGAMYWLLVRGSGQPTTAATADAGRVPAATDQLTEEDRRELDDLIRQRLRSADGGNP